VSTLTTPRLVLRPLERDDVDALWPYVSDPDLPRFMSWDPHRDRAETEAFIAAVVAGRQEGKGHVWIIRHDDVLVGVIGLEDIVRTMRAWRQDRGEIGYWCGPPFQNRGFVTEAAREVMRFGFEDVGLHKIRIGCVSDNAPSRHVIEKLGFRFVGEERDHFFRYGRWWNHRAYEMIIDEWRARG